jgi:hypothetical protein
MFSKRTAGTLFIAACVVAIVLVLSEPATGQCSLCKNAITGSPSAAKLSQSLNSAIIVLLIPPVLIFCGIFFVAYRHRKSGETARKPPAANARFNNFS